jgi:ABC-2 type transport system ATP-binding protein
MDEAQIQERTRELIPRFNLEPYLQKSIESLSHGTRQRIAIVSALMHAPEVFVLDEPMVGLDPHHQFILKEVLKERAADGMTVFLSTHQISVAEEVADRIGIIHMGKLVAVGTKEELHAISGRSKAELEETYLALTSEESDVSMQRQVQQG